MGAKCCVASRKQESTGRRDRPMSTHRNVGLSPMWTLQRNNRTHVEDVQVNNQVASHRIHKNVTYSGTKIRERMGKENFSSVSVKKTDTHSKSPSPPEGSKSVSAPNQSHAGDRSALKEKTGDTEMSNNQNKINLTVPKASVPFLVINGEPSSSQSSDLEKPSEEKSTHGLSMSSGQNCEVCTKPMEFRSPWAISGPPVVGVLGCGHIFHAECLEHVTSEQDKFDPPCPLCSGQHSVQGKKGPNKKSVSHLVKRKNGGPRETTGKFLGIRFNK